jgi:hypothetical protein
MQNGRLETREAPAVDLKVPIAISDELTDEVIAATGLLDLASGEIRRVEYIDYDAEAEGPPWEADDYEFSCGTLSHQGKDVEFRVDVNKVTGQYSVSATELLEIKMRAAALFAGISGKGLLDIAEQKTEASAPAAKSRRSAPPGRRK